MGNWTPKGVLALAAFICILQIVIWHQVVLQRERQFDDRIQERLQHIADMMQEDALCVNLNTRQHLAAGSDFFLIMPSEEGKAGDTIRDYSQVLDTGFNPVNRSRFRMDLPAQVDISVNMQFMVPPDLKENVAPTNLELEVLEELNSSLWTEIAGNAVKLLDTVLLRQAVNEELLVHPVQDVDFAVIDKSNEVVKFRSTDWTEELEQGSSNVRMPLIGEGFGNWHLYAHFPSKHMAFIQDALPLLGLMLVSIAALGIWLWSLLRNVSSKKRLANMQMDFVHSITHEFNTPVTNISFALETIKSRNAETEHVADLIEIIEQAKERLSANVKKLFAVSVYQGEDLLLDKEIHDIHEILNLCIRQLKPIMEQNKSTISTDFNAADPWLELDPTYICNAINCILENSVKYGGNGVIISVNTFDQKDFVVIDITDNGPGIPQSVRTKVFEKFFRRDQDKSVQGSGIGLYFAKQVVEAHGGLIEVVPSPKSGVTVRLYLRKDEEESG